MFGGLGTALNPLNDLWKLDLQTTTWTSQAPYGPAPPASWRPLTLAEQRVAYLFGGESSSNAVLNDLHLLHLGPGSSDGQPTPRWELITANVSGSGMPLALPALVHAAPLLNVGPGTDGMLLFGGVDNAGNALDDLHSLQFATLFWRTPNPRVSSHRSAGPHHCAAAQFDPRALRRLKPADAGAYSDVPCSTSRGTRGSSPPSSRPTTRPSAATPLDGHDRRRRLHLWRRLVARREAERPLVVQRLRGGVGACAGRSPSACRRRPSRVGATSASVTLAIRWPSSAARARATCCSPTCM